MSEFKKRRKKSSKKRSLEMKPFLEGTVTAKDLLKYPVDKQMLYLSRELSKKYNIKYRATCFACAFNDLYCKKLD